MSNEPETNEETVETPEQEAAAADEAGAQATAPSDAEKAVPADEAAPDEAAPVEEDASAEEPATAAAELTLGTGAPAEASDEPYVEPTVRGKIDRFGTAMGTGRRKTAVARVRVTDGDGQFTINGRPMEEFFTIERDQKQVVAPLMATETAGKVNVWVRVSGGGITGQTGAVVLGVARALHVKDPGLHHALASHGFLTRDSRMVERKKYGFKKARRSFQFSKR